MFGFFNRAKAAPKTSEPIDVSTRTDVNLGDLGRDKVTGFSGVVTTLVHQMDGTILVGMQPPSTEAGRPADPYEFDVERIEVVTSGYAKIGNTDAVKAAIKIGAVYRDRVSGFEGVCTSRIDFLGGCTRLHLTGKVDKDNKSPEPMNIPVERAELVDVKPAAEAAKRKTPTGGPGKHEAAMMKRMSAR